MSVIFLVLDSYRSHSCPSDWMIVNIPGSRLTAVSWHRIIGHLSGATLSPQSRRPTVARVQATQLLVALLSGITLSLIYQAPGYCGFSLSSIADLPIVSQSFVSQKLLLTHLTVAGHRQSIRLLLSLSGTKVVSTFQTSDCYRYPCTKVACFSR